MQNKSPILIREVTKSPNFHEKKSVAFIYRKQTRLLFCEPSPISKFFYLLNTLEHCGKAYFILGKLYNHLPEQWNPPKEINKYPFNFLTDTNVSNGKYF